MSFELVESSFTDEVVLVQRRKTGTERSEGIGKEGQEVLKNEHLKKEGSSLVFWLGILCRTRRGS